jgi:hypothetical protein
MHVAVAVLIVLYICTILSFRMLALHISITSPTSGGRSVGIVRSRTQTMEFRFFSLALLT